MKNYVDTANTNLKSYADVTFVKGYAAGSIQTITSDLTVTGNLVINGVTTTVNTTTIATTDSLIELAKYNTAGDSLDIGFYGAYQTGGFTRYTGLFRKAADKFYLAQGITVDPTANNVGQYGVNYRATLDGNFTGGSVSGLSQAITVSDGGTGVQTIPTGQIVIGNGTGNILTLANTGSSAGASNGTYIPIVSVDQWGRTSVTGNVIVTDAGANSYADLVGTRANTYSINYTNIVGGYANNYSMNYANTIGVYSNNYTNIIGGYANTYSTNYTNTVGGYANTYADSVGTRANTFATNAITTANNNNISYTNAQIVANLSIAQAWSNTVGGYANTYADSVGTRANTYSTNYTNTVGGYANTYSTNFTNTQVTANLATSQAWANTVGGYANTYATNAITTANNNNILYTNAQIVANLATSQAWANTVGGYANTFATNTVTTANNNNILYTNAQIVANLAIAQAWANTVGGYANNYTTSRGYLTGVTGNSGAIVVTTGTNPTINLATTAVTPGTYGGSTQIPVITIDSFGRATALANASVTIPSALTITDDNATNSTLYPLFANATGVTATTIFTDSSDLTFNPSTGTLSAVIFTSLSDQNMKDNIQTVPNALETVNQLNGVSFNWKFNGNKSYGVIAQEIEQVIPDIVQTSENGNKTVDYQALSAFLIEAIKELSNEIEQLKKNK